MPLKFDPRKDNILQFPDRTSLHLSIQIEHTCKKRLKKLGQIHFCAKILNKKIVHVWNVNKLHLINFSLEQTIFC
jgi:hypothetical protein